jgi:hypothetical protein
MTAPASNSNSAETVISIGPHCQDLDDTFSSFDSRPRYPGSSTTYTGDGNSLSYSDDSSVASGWENVDDDDHDNDIEGNKEDGAIFF